MGAVDFSIDAKVVECLQRALPISVFVETGTFEGDAVARVRNSFDEIHSIELAEPYYARATERFADDPHVRLHLGNSSDVLASLRPKLVETGVLYWLDAHWCVAEGTAGQHSQCPLLDELAALNPLNTSSVVLIDDARLFLATPPSPHEASEWPRLQQVLRLLLTLSSSHEVAVINDVIVFYPETARDAVSEYARCHGVDWLAELEQKTGLEQERDLQASVAAERLVLLEEMRHELELQASTAKERLTLIENLEHERDQQARIADERLRLLEEVARERDLQAAVARERLETLTERSLERHGPEPPRGWQ